MIVDQRLSPSDDIDSQKWELLGRYAVSDGTLEVELTNQFDDAYFVSAGSVRVENDGPFVAQASIPQSCGVDGAPGIQDLTAQLGPIHLEIENYSYEGGYPSRHRTESVIYYLISDGSDFAGLKYETSPKNLLAKVLNPDEEIIYWEYWDMDGNKFTSGGEPELPETFCMGESGVYQVRVFGHTGDKNVVSLHTEDDLEYGINFQYGLFQDWDGMPDPLYAWAPIHRDIPIQVELKRYQLSSDELFVNVYDETADDVLLTLSPQSGSATIVMVPSTTEDGHLLRIESRQPNWRFRARGFPFILTNTREAAQMIHASVDRIESGPYQGALVAHKFQRDTADLMPILLNHAGDRQALHDAAPDNYPATNPECWNPEDPQDIIRHNDFLNHYHGVLPAARAALKVYADSNTKPSQNMEPNSRWLGSFRYDDSASAICTEDSQCPQGACVLGSCEDEQWSTFDVHTTAGRKMNTGGSSKTAFPGSMAFAATTRHPCNFYGPDTSIGVIQYPEILIRAAMASLFDAYGLAESDVYLYPNIDDAFYSGGYSLNSMDYLFTAYSYGAKHLPKLLTAVDGNELLGQKVQRVWTNAMRNILDRTLTQNMASSMNQTAHNLVGYAQFAIGAEGLPIQNGYRDVTRRWSSRFISEKKPGGFWSEGAGIDATYPGIQHNRIAIYLRLTEDSPQGLDEDMLEALREAYIFYNHTIGKENGDEYTGGFNFAGRTPGDFAHEQYLGARGVIERLGEVSYRVEPSDGDNTALYNLAQGFEDKSSYVYDKNTMGIGSVPREGLYSDPSRRPGDYVLPANESDSFIRNFDDILIAIKRPAYFVSLFVGKSTAQWVIDKSTDLFREPYVNEGLAPGIGESFDGRGPDGRIHPFVGGGITFLHTQDLGSAIVSTNWSPQLHHGLVLEPGDGKKYWTRYHSRDFSLDTANGILTTSGTMEGANFSFTRTFSFLDDRIDVSLDVVANEDITLDKLTEVFPIPTCTRLPCNPSNPNTGYDNAGDRINRKQSGATLFGLGTGVDGFYDTNTNAFGMQDDIGNGITIETVTDQHVTAGEHGLRNTYYSKEFQVGWAEIHLPIVWTAGQTHTLNYSIRPF